MTDITYLTHVKFDHGMISALTGELVALGVKRPLLVSDRGPRRRDAGARATAAAAGSPAFLDVPTNPTEEATLAALAIYKAEGCDGVVGFGGGSPVDLSKAVALLASNEGPLSRYAAIDGGVARIKRDDPAGDCDPHDGRHGIGGRACRARHAGGRPQGRADQPAPDPATRHLRPD